MARPPIAPIAPAEPLVIVDGRTNIVLHSPIARDPNTGELLDGRSGTLALVTREDASIAPIHSTLEAAGVDVGDGSYSCVIAPRAAWMRLAPHANKRIYLRLAIPGSPPVFQAVRVVWRADTYPTPERT